MSDSKLLYNVPLQVVLPPLAESPTDCNINKMDSVDKKLCKELNLTATSDSNNSHTATAAAEAAVSSAISAKDKQPGQNEETDGSISMTSSEKQEWSVTLYDVDRKGNVSEEDLARLVTMLYKAAGSSITVPHSQPPSQLQSPGTGSKKIKLRLSVAPDNNNQTKVYIQKPLSSPADPPSNGPSNTPGGTSRVPMTQSAVIPPQQTNNSSYHNRHLGSKRDKKQHRQRQHSSEGMNHGTGGHEGQTSRHSHRKKTKKRHSRSASLDKNGRTERTCTQEGPVQENMDRRQYYKDLVGIENETLQSLGGFPDERVAHNRTAPPGMLPGVTMTQEKNGEKSQTVYLPPEKGTTTNRDKKGGSKRYSKQVHFEGNSGDVCAGNNDNKGNWRHLHRFNHSTSPCSKQSSKSQSGRSRPKSCPATGGIVTGSGRHAAGLQMIQDDLVSKQEYVDSFEKEIQEGLNSLNVHFSSTPAKPGAAFLSRNQASAGGISYNFGGGGMPTLNLDCGGNTNNNLEGISPHHMRRHRNREHEYNRSMKQVAEWIQRQHTCSPTPTEPNDGSPITTDPVVLKHEHHHIHEHHHHYHFYHYYET